MCPACLAAAAAVVLKAASASGAAAYAAAKLYAKTKPIESKPSVAEDGDRA